MENELYKSILHHSPTGYAYHKLIFDEKGEPSDYEFLEINPAFENLTGLKADQVIGRRATQILPGLRDGLFDWVAFYTKLAINGGRAEFTQFSEPLNSWYRVTAYSPQKNYFITYFNDVSGEIRQIKELDTFFKVTPDLLCVIDQEGNFVKVNKAWERLLGYKTADLINTEFISLIHPEERQFVQKILAIMTIQAGEANFVNRYRCQDYSYRYIDWRCHSHGNQIYMAARDVTDKVEERRITDKLVEYSEEFLQMTAAEIDYQKITDYLLDISGAQYGSFSLYDPEEEMFETVAIAGLTETLDKVSSMLGYNPIGQRWAHDPEQMENIKGNILSVFPNLKELSKDIVPEAALDYLEKHYPTGEAVVVKILKNSELVGNFSFTMPLGKAFKNRSAVEIFTRQVGLLLARIQAEKAVRNQKAYFEALFLNTTDAMLYFDGEERIFNINEQFTQLFGYELEDLKGENVNTIFQPLESPGGKISQRILRGETIVMENLRYTKTGKPVPVLIKGGPVLIEGEIKGGYAVYTDITERKAYEEHLKHLSIYDQLTGLYNRNFFETEIKIIEKSKKYPISIISCDVDGLKIVNDTLGHSQGDKLLQLAADFLSKSLRGSDILARTGGDEFVAILPKTDEQTVEKIAQRIRKNITQANQENLKLPVSISIGVATASNHEEPLQEALKKADERMYHEKLIHKKSSRGEMIAFLLNALAELKKPN